MSKNLHPSDIEIAATDKSDLEDLGMFILLLCFALLCLCLHLVNGLMFHLYFDHFYFLYHSFHVAKRQKLNWLYIYI